MAAETKIEVRSFNVVAIPARDTVVVIVNEAIPIVMSPNAARLLATGLTAALEKFPAETPA